MKMRQLLPCMALILSACSMQDTQWSFTNTLPRGTQGEAIQTAKEAGGLRVRTQNENGLLYWQGTPLAGPADALTLWVQSDAPVQASFFWQPQGDTEEASFVQLPLTLPAASEPVEVSISLSEYDEWFWQTPIVGLLLPPSSNVLLTRMHTTHWSVSEKAVELWRGLWRMDDFGLHSINFLWGPRISTNPVSRSTLFDHMPPVADSANALIYAFLFCVMVAVSVLWFLRPAWWRWHAATVVLWCICVLWLLYDLRMGSEILSYARADWQQYILADEDDRTLRTHGSLYRTIDRFLPHIMQEERYALVMSNFAPIRALLRYASYPSVPVVTEEPNTDMRLWVIMERPDVSVSESGALMRGQQILAAHGEVLDYVQPGTFLYRASPSAP